MKHVTSLFQTLGLIGMDGDASLTTIALYATLGLLIAHPAAPPDIAAFFLALLNYGHRRALRMKAENHIRQNGYALERAHAENAAKTPELDQDIESFRAAIRTLSDEVTRLEVTGKETVSRVDSLTLAMGFKPPVRQ